MSATPTGGADLSAGVRFQEQPDLTFWADPETGRITIYYGAADTVTGLAFTTVDELFAYMRKYPMNVGDQENK